MDPWPKDPKRPGPKAAPSPGESLLVCWAKAQARSGGIPISESAIQILMLATTVLRPRSVLRFSFVCCLRLNYDSAYTVLPAPAGHRGSV